MLFNVLLQVLVGFPLEVMFGWWRMAIVYLVGVITGQSGQKVVLGCHSLQHLQPIRTSQVTIYPHNPKSAV